MSMTPETSFHSLHLNTHSGGAIKTSSNLEFSNRLKRGMAQGAALTYQSIAPVANFVPGGAIMSSMLHSAGSTLASEGLTPQTTISPPLGLGAELSGAPMGAALNSTSGNSGMFQSMENLQQNMMSMNVYMLGLQQGFNDMNQKFTAISNVLKTKHDTEKNAINNFR